MGTELDHHQNQVRLWVWSGFLTPDDVAQRMDDLVQDGADEVEIRRLADQFFKQKRESEADWPSVTDCDRIGRAFAELNSRGVIALQYAGYTMSDGHSDVGEELDRRGRDRVKGYCFFHEQDVERAVDGGGLMIAFGDLNAEPDHSRAIGQLVSDVLKEQGLQVDWCGRHDKRIGLPKLDWQKRSEKAEVEFGFLHWLKWRLFGG